MNLEQAYARCEEITRTEAKNFSYGIRLLPSGKRQAMSALYAMARRIDDIGDGDRSPEDKLQALEAVRKDLAVVASGSPPANDADPVLVALDDAARRYPVPVLAFDDLVDGCERDVLGTRYETFDDLVGYCRQVAGSVGRLSLGVFGTAQPAAAEPLADALGVALQLTNILRDIVEDREQMGRIYLPAADIAQFGCDPDLRGPEDSVMALIVYEAVRARQWYADGLRLLPRLDRRSRACTAAMAGIYQRLLARIVIDPGAVMRTRVSLPGWEKGWVAVRSLAGASG